ncbi:MAG TPA: AzlC family ABC transporter permease [Thermoanaerobaculia bacterium]|nr:AzlC family ABC transporter permease [Thermoanaerobaculia bacterium]
MTRDVAAICAAVALVGLSFGALAVAGGLSIWMAAALSLLVLAGGSQFLVVGVIAAGAGPWAGVVGGLLINARHVPFGLAMSDTVGKRTLSKLLGAHLLVDEVVAFSRAQGDPRRATIAYWTCGLALAITWNVATLAGAWLGDAIPDPALLGVDAAFPAALLALLLPGLRGGSMEAATARRVAVTGSLIALALSPLLPAGIPVLAGLAGLAAAGRATQAPEAP